MDINTRQPGQYETKPETRRLLTAAEYFLQQRNLADCFRYAVRARDSDPAHPTPTQILSIASVLSASKISPAQYDYYGVLNLPYFDYDVDRIGSNFKTLASILDPKSNPCPFSSEAFQLVVKAWSVLSSPVEKAKFDDELRRMLTGCTSGSGAGTFWTMCPYCYYVYEYDKVFEDCCLRCANEKCRRVLHAVAIGAPPPPPDEVAKGQYWCAGFMPFAIGNSNGEGIGEKLWSPFAPATGCRGNGGDGNVVSNGDCVVNVVLIDEKGGNEGAETVEGKGVETIVEGEAGVSGDKKDAKGEKPESTGGNAMENGVKEGRIKRKKSVPWNSKKLMGRGFIINTNQAQLIYGVGDGGRSNVNGNDVENGVEFFEGDDDVFVSIPFDFEA